MFSAKSSNSNWAADFEDENDENEEAGRIRGDSDVTKEPSSVAPIPPTKPPQFRAGGYTNPGYSASEQAMVDMRIYNTEHWKQAVFREAILRSGRLWHLSLKFATISTRGPHGSMLQHRVMASSRQVRLFES